MEIERHRFLSRVLSNEKRVFELQSARTGRMLIVQGVQMIENLFATLIDIFLVDESPAFVEFEVCFCFFPIRKERYISSYDISQWHDLFLY